MVTDIEVLQQILDHEIFNNALKVDPVEHKIMLTEPPNNPKPNREALIEIMFDGFNV